MASLSDIDLPALVQLIGYPGIFAVIFLESGVFFGFFLPGASLLFIAGILAAAGIFNIWLLAPLVGAAAILGDNVGYWFGSKVGAKLFSRPDSRFFKQAYMDKTRIFFEKYGTRTIVFARFVPIVRTFAPILAGIGGMNYRLFFIYNVIGASVWASGVVFLGYTVGSKVPNAEIYITPIVLTIIAVSCIPLIIHWSRREHVPRVKRCPKAAIFDIDDTLTESFKPPSSRIVEKLRNLLDLIPIALMTATGFPRIEKEFLPLLSKSPHLSRLYLFPNSTAECFMWREGAWKRVYGYELTEEERGRIKKAFEESVAETGVLEGMQPRGEQVIDRRAQIAFAALGLEAENEEKKSWDVDKTKRTVLKKVLDKKIPDFEILIGGRTTIDITRKGINKAHGVRWLGKHLDLKAKEMLYVGDALYPGGNDAVVIPTGIQTLSTASPEETETIIDDILKVCSAVQETSVSATTGSTKNT